MAARGTKGQVFKTGSYMILTKLANSFGYLGALVVQLSGLLSHAYSNSK